ncbi:CYTH domain-containing protein [Floricoccus penangensis]|uniref:CYTH domain-containing protein n=1 Tax=Floricoccus penangensis TaxID=1859475 RepID=UPI00204255C2|nr:CYTH domain-containing protein [Floricoccus penangensis]URZ87160.1 CYTH domain-containing protein [Floricoccus penangensis]
MTTNLEIEYKTLLSLDEYDRLKKYFSHVTPIRQTNHYMDSPDLIMRSNRLALRIRTFDNDAEMTLKVPQAIGNIEHNAALTLEEAHGMLESKKINDNLPQISDILSILKERGIDYRKITVLGSLTTIRQEMETDIGLMALDKNTYFDACDYELELEVQDSVKGKKDFKKFLIDKNVEFRYAKSKVVRFLKMLDNKTKN